MKKNKRRRNKVRKNKTRRGKTNRWIKGKAFRVIRKRGKTIVEVKAR